MPGAPAREWGLHWHPFPPINTAPRPSLEKRNPPPLSLPACTSFLLSLLFLFVSTTPRAMKPPHFTGEAAGASWAHEVKQTLRDKLRWPAAGTSTAGVASAKRPTASKPATPAAQTSHGEDGRRSAAAAEDPIRRVMFLAPWGHT
ncbi:unnamed protein product [Alopecurus aequalis]